MTRKELIESTESHDDGFIIYLKPGFHSGNDPLAPEHAIFGDTRRGAYAQLKSVAACKCRDCR